MGELKSVLKALLKANLTDAVAELKAIDAYITEISKANSRLSSSELAEIANNSFAVASAYGKKASDYLSAVQEMADAGYKNADAIAEISTALQSAGNITQDIANQYIIAADKAYALNGSVTELNKIFDGANNITNKNAVNMAELAEGMSIASSIAASLGMQVNHSTAAMSTLLSVTRQSGSEAAKAFMSLLFYIKQVSDEAAGVDAEGLIQYEKACSALGVSLKETKNGILQMRDAMDVLKELSAVYKQLEGKDSRRTALLDSVGGGINADALDALLQNYDMYEKMLKEYEDGAGSMARQAGKTADSWEGSLNRLGNTWTETVNNIANSDAVIAGINMLNDLLKVVNQITDALDPLETISIGLGGIGAKILSQNGLD